jgi:hypothetical protein
MVELVDLPPNIKRSSAGACVFKSKSKSKSN